MSECMFCPKKIKAAEVESKDFDRFGWFYTIKTTYADDSQDTVTLTKEVIDNGVPQLQKAIYDAVKAYEDKQ